MIEANLTNKKETTIIGLFQWDYGQIVKVTGITETDDLEIHIGNDSSETYQVKSITVYDDYFTFQIPDSLLQASKTIKAIIYYDSGTEGKSKKVINFQVKARTKPEDYITPDDENYKYIVPKGGTTGQVLVKKSDADGDTDWSDVGGVSSFNINSLTEENDLADGDYLALYDTSATAHRKTLWSNIKTKLKAYFDTLYSAVNHSHNEYASSSHNHSGVYQPVETGKGLSTNDFTTTLKTKLEGIAEGAEVNVNADWNATSGDAQILNKPTIPTVTNDLTDTLKGNYDTAYAHSQQAHAPSNAEANVQADWNQTDTGADDYIKNKPTIPSAYTLPKASASTLGGVKVGANLSIDSNGVLSATGGTEYALPVASASTLGGVMPVAKTDAMTQDVGVDGNGKLYTASGSGGSGGMTKIIDYAWDCNTEYQPLTLDFATGVMTFASDNTPPINQVMALVPNDFSVLSPSGNVNDAFAKIPNEFLAKSGTYCTLASSGNGFTFGGVTSLAEGGVNVNVDVTKFHFERPATPPSYTGLNATELELRFSVLSPSDWTNNNAYFPSINTGEANTDGVQTGLGAFGNRLFTEYLFGRFVVSDGKIISYREANVMLYQTRTAGNTKTTISRVTSQTFSLASNNILAIFPYYGNGNWFPANGSVLEVWAK